MHAHVCIIKIPLTSTHYKKKKTQKSPSPSHQIGFGDLWVVSHEFSCYYHYACLVFSHTGKLATFNFNNKKYRTNSLELTPK